MKMHLVLVLALMFPLNSTNAAEQAAALAATPAPTSVASVTPAPGAELSAFFARLKAGEKQTVVAYGTSLTKYGPWVKAMTEYFDAAYPGLVTVVNSGGPGQGSNWGQKYVQSRVVDKKPDLVLMEFTYNDAHTRLKTSLEASRENFEKMIKVIREANPRTAIVLQTMNAPWNKPGGTAETDRPQLRELNEQLRAIAQEQGLPFLDHYAGWNAIKTGDLERYKTLVPDGSHPGKVGSLEVTWAGVKALFEKAGGAATVDVSK